MIHALYLAALFCAAASVLVLADFPPPVRLACVVAAVVLFGCALILGFRAPR